MAKGPPPDPRRARRGTGTRPLPGEQKSALAKAPPVQAELAEARPPKDLPRAVRTVWSACVTEMAGNRHLRAPDLVLLKTYCEAVATHAAASSDVHKRGLLVENAFGPCVNPMVKVQKDAAVTIRQLSDVLGLNPLARIRAGILEIAGASMVMDIRERLLKQVQGVQ